jgi:hypothetical protein
MRCRALIMESPHQRVFVVSVVSSDSLIPQAFWRVSRPFCTSADCETAVLGYTDGERLSMGGGWKTLIVYSKGRSDVLMRFNGKRYPLNPSSQPKATPEQVHAAHIVME